MKLAEALIERAELKKTLTSLESRMEQNVKVQEGDIPAEDIKELMKMYEELMCSLEDLIIRINKTNTKYGISEMITHRDQLKSCIKVLRNLYDEGVSRCDRYSRSEIKFISCINGREMQKRIDDLSKECREVDIKIQAQNWTVDLV